MQFPVRESSVQALGRMLLYQVRVDPLNTTGHASILTSLVSAMQDESSEVRRRALSALKAVAKVHTILPDLFKITKTYSLLCHFLGC